MVTDHNPFAAAVVVDRMDIAVVVDHSPFVVVGRTLADRILVARRVEHMAKLAGTSSAEVARTFAGVELAHTSFVVVVAEELVVDKQLVVVVVAASSLVAVAVPVVPSVSLAEPAG